MPLLQHRIDLSDWVIHFVHDRKMDDDYYILADIWSDEGLEEDKMVKMPITHYFDKNGMAQGLYNEYEDKEYDIEDEAKAFDVLKKIVHDGYIRSGWSFRNNQPTIYGPFSAVCFTEMPLYALINYAKARGDYSGYVGKYGIAFKKRELFAAGARPVIYGISRTHKELENNEDTWYGLGMRVLDRTCGIGLQEQYRYVYTNLAKSTPIDWTHEREWRWPLIDDRFVVGGMPFLLSREGNPEFTEAIVIVETVKEQEELLEQIKNQFDSRYRECGYAYNVDLLSSIRVVALDELANASIDTQTIRIEDIPSKQMRRMPEFEVSEALRQKVRNEIPTAIELGLRAIMKFKEDNPDYVYPVCNYGYGYIVTYDISEVTQALLEEGIVSSYSDGGYYLFLGDNKWPNEDVDLIRLGAEVSADFLTKELGQRFFVKIRLD